jgi:hypothetical protein
MENNQDRTEQQSPPARIQIEGLLWFVLLALLIFVAGILIVRNWNAIKSFINPPEIANYDEVIVSDGFHHIQLENGQSWQLSYEADHERNFAGVVRHTSPINEHAFAILSHDILVTSQDFADPDLVDTSVSNHHFTWRSRNQNEPVGTINLLHTVPMNEEVRLQLDAIQNGDTVIITGWDIYRIDGFDSAGNAVGYWQDSGCNTTLVIKVEVVK